ncbi:uncharacterized protein PGTG_05907 [Puccinia graminis f. sp. tritici CRL 75-36-700-3]|uniref:Uncharacterized protein n=1 Tax=Puccinia graminis f. sp. tritici (strain CRL 75-36-700-3 / race SCCL) TaxID=418459 RepID=E3K615_PUCGT|nr:uncharacterized protein PGTG_05907 [Puccinia graminis f. sp. tritici CRL 75-36-700-3]EFP79586.1 hypothetical protein PGTG_05907 [Puccinia graminis f. sp. tritici CRL 75-36-700-3]
MYPSKFFFIMISVLAHFSLSIRQAQAQCPTAKVDQNDCVIASRMIQFGTDDSIVKGESKIVVRYGGCLVTLDKVTCGTSKLPSAINLQDCISSIPKFFGTQSNVEIRITTKTCSVYLKSSNRMFLPESTMQNKYK